MEWIVLVSYVWTVLKMEITRVTSMWLKKLMEDVVIVEILKPGSKRDSVRIILVSLKILKSMKDN